MVADQGNAPPAHAGGVGVVLCHGFTGSPVSMERRAAKAISIARYASSAVTTGCSPVFKQWRKCRNWRA